MGDSDIVREPSPEETHGIDEARKALLRIIREQHSLKRPLNVCLYTAFPKNDWDLKSDSFLVELWINHDPETSYLKMNADSKMALERAIRWPRPVSSTHHWEVCKLIWGNASPVTSSCNDASKSLNLRFEFDYPMLTLDRSYSLLPYDTGLPPQPGGSRQRTFYSRLNQLDDIILTNNFTKTVDAVYYARIPYISVPIAAIFMPQRTTDNSHETTIALFQSVSKIQAVLSTYVHVAIMNTSIFFAKQMIKRCSTLYDMLDIIVPLSLGFSMACILFPVGLRIFTRSSHNTPAFTITLDGNYSNYKCSEPESFQFMYSLGEKAPYAFRIEIDLLDHENPYLGSFESVQRLLEKPLERVTRVSTSPFYRYSIDMLRFALDSAKQNLEAFVGLHLNKQHSHRIRELANKIKSDIAIAEHKLDALSSAEPGYYIVLRQFIDVIEQIGKEDKLLSEVLERLNQITDNSFIDFVDTYTRETPTKDIKHAIYKHPALADLFTKATESFVSKCMKELHAEYDDGETVAGYLTSWLAKSVRVTEEGKEISWPIIVQAGKLSRASARDILKQLFKEVLAHDIEVNVNEGTSGWWRGSLPLLMFVFEAVFRRTTLVGKTISVYFDTSWNLSWVQTCDLEYQKSRKTFEEILHDPKYNAENVSFRMLIVRKVFGSLEGYFEPVGVDDQKCEMKMLWSL